MTGDFGEGLTALRGSEGEEYPVRRATGPALSKVSCRSHSEIIGHTHVS